KVMGLASYGQPEFKDEFARIVRLEGQQRKPRFNLGLDYFIHHKVGSQISWDEGAPVVGKLYSNYLEKRLGAARDAGSVVEERHHHIASSFHGPPGDSSL